MTRSLNLLKVENNLIYYTNEDKDYVLSSSSRALINKGLVVFFTKKDRDLIHALDPITKFDIKWYGFLTALYLAFLLVAIPMSPHSVQIFDTWQPAGILIFPLTFLVLDTINATLRYEYAKSTTYFGASMCALASGLIALTFLVFDIKSPYKEVFEPLIYLFLINSICILSADQANNFTFRKLSMILYKSPLWVRSIISSTIGQAIYTIIWIGLFFNSSTSMDLLQKIADNYLFKVGYAFALLPVLYGLVISYKLLKSRKNDDSSVINKNTNLI
ncbi:VUT family protein [Vibrio hepatarius]|uniref:VUT family protein n=1 Tax=Vibrio hepatarius TaxID=171383 RepID=UPI001C08B1E3|nr:VUT family protein [Vibrio hepatarius]MBU2898489.1 VUT family protein [Vibrio hepatarius]